MALKTRSAPQFSPYCNAFDSQQMNNSLIHHLFLPCDLPSSAEADYLMQSNHQNEYQLLDQLKNFLVLWEAKSLLPIFSVLQNCVENWLFVQNEQNCSISMLQSTIQNLRPGDFLPLYFHAQNAAILIEMDENPANQPLISAWQVSLPTETITSSLEPHFAHFPSPMYRLASHAQLTSQTHCELLVEFMNNTIEYFKSYKSSHTFDEIRDVPVSHYVCQWWITHFQGIQIEKPVLSSVQFKKKHRDQIRWKDANLPFRRSGLWMTIKVVFHTILTKRLGKIGTIVYKLMITAFLTDVIYKRQTSVLPRLSTDLLIHCLRKIVRRLDKIENLISSNDLNEWISNVQDQIKSKINLIIPEDDWQEFLKKTETERPRISINSNQADVYRHPCSQLKAYFSKQHSIKSSNQSSHNSDFFSSIPKFDRRENDLPSIAFLTNEAKYSIDIALTRMEIWVEFHLDQWLNHSLNPFTRFEQLLNFFEDYQRTALDHYYGNQQGTDPIGYSRFILTCLTIIRLMHQTLSTDKRFERLKLHNIEIPHLLDLFEFLILPTRDEMVRARNLYDFCHNFSCKSHPDILSDIESTNAFGIYFADRSPSLNKTLQKIQTQVEQDQSKKIDEVTKAKKQYDLLIKRAYSLQCLCNLEFHYRTCDRCTIIQQANNIKVHIYESPIPSERNSALAVIFELQMPIELRCYRDILWMFVNRLDTKPSNSKMLEWLSVAPHNTKLSQFYNSSRNWKVKLVSSNKSISQTHYSAPRHVTATPIEEFLYENSLRVQISPTQPGTFEDECQTLTPQLTNENYTHLQFSINSTQSVQNQVIAELSSCSLRLKTTQFVDFGSFRSGHRLQWWNLLSALESDALLMDEESVAVLLTHALLQYGPVTTNKNVLSCSWCSEAHQILLEEHFVEELISRLDRLLTNCGMNWQNELVLVIITVITMRIFSCCNSTQINQIKILVMKCRSTGEKWIELINESIRNASSFGLENVDELRDKIVIIGTVCLLTFSTNQDQLSHLLSSNEDILSLLKAITTVHDNIILNKKQKNTNVFVRNLLRITERNLVLIHPTVSRILQKTSYECLNEFTGIYWTAIGNNVSENGKWKKRNGDIYDGWYDGQYQSSKISIDFLRGTFLINGMTIGFLPEEITSNPLFTRVFGDHVFEVQAGEQNNTYTTKYSYHGDRKVHYEFSYNYSHKHLIIEERYIQTNVRYELIPSSCFQTEFPDLFISNYSHWKNHKTQEIEFRPVRFQHSQFLIDKDYILTMQIGHLTTDNTQILVNRASSFFQNLFHRFFIRLDDEPYVYMFRENTSPIIHIYLSRLGIAFKYDIKENMITSREYPDMYVDENQWFGTLTGLTGGLLLSPIVSNNQTNRYYLCRKLLVPYGRINAMRLFEQSHPSIAIDRTGLEKSFHHQCFVFILNDRLRILQAIESPSGFLYLALLHAMTSHALPDEYTDLTGMECAFQLLNSAGCCSDQPFDALSLDILYQIATLSPQVSYYPSHLTCMKRIDWNSHGLSRFMQHFGYYLIAKNLFEISEQWNFIHPSSDSSEMRKLFQSKKYDERLLRKLYWNYRDSYNPLARLSPEMEMEIRSVDITNPYHSQWKIYPSKRTYKVLHLVNNLYLNGNIDLKDSDEVNCFPLARWLTSEYTLKHTWIGLFKFVEQLRTSTNPHPFDEIERFELLLDFLHYISGKDSIEPFYLQILKSILRSSRIVLRSVPYPSFKTYTNIEETTVHDNRIKFSKKWARTKQPLAIQEIRQCFEQNRSYQNERFPERNINKYEINQLLQSWRANELLCSFLENIQNYLNSITIVLFDMKITVYPAEFTIQSCQEHYQMSSKPTRKRLNQLLVERAQKKFRFPHSNYFIQPTKCVSIVNEQKEFPIEIFSFADWETNSLSNIANHFKEQLTESWRQFQAIEEYRKEHPSLKHIHQVLHLTHDESSQLWDELVNSITSTNELLFNTGLIVRIVPSTLISIFQQIWLEECDSSSSKKNVDSFPLFLTVDQCTLLGGIMVNWIVEQQLHRALHFAQQAKWEDFEREISNIPHANWTPSEHLPWLIIELEMNITIREIQVEVARHMIQPQISKNNTQIRNMVMQMNMGEGKTSVILPMLAVSLCSSSSSLVRIIVLKSLFPTNYQSLRYKLGGFFNRRVLPFSCRRDMNLNTLQISQIFNRLQYALNHRHVILTSPEDILSFDLLTIDKCRRNEFDVSRLILSIQSWLKRFARDVLDESDEILHVKYQLVYSVGGQQQVDGGMERWKMIQLVLNLVKKYAASMAEQYPKEIFYRISTRSSHFSEIRLLSHQPFARLCRQIANDWLNQKSYRQENHQLILSFILDASVSIELLIDRFPTSILQQFLILRGLLSSEVLFVALQRRYRVKFGINSNPKFKRLMAVPFRAKDVAAENTEFGHPDVAIILTQLAYYYSGLNDTQMLQCFDRLNQEEKDPDVIYTDWISQEGKANVHPSIDNWKAVNLKDYLQRTRYLFPTLRQNMLVVNYFLNHFVFPREAKQFPQKLVSSAWDLSSSFSRTHLITGFSGTNDTQLLLPIDIRQCDLAELQKTDAIVLNNLLQSKNENYRSLSANSNSDQILQEIVSFQPTIQVILDVGALFVDGTNRQIAIKWFKLSNKNAIDYVVYFEGDEIFVCDRRYQRYAFLTSPASERLERCIFYLDEIHTRGTDFKFPNDFHAAVTLGNGLTKDRLVQACMRMRQLGKHHWLSFWSSNEVHQQIQTMKKNSIQPKENTMSNDQISLIDVLRWVYENTQQATWDGLHHWAAQSLSYQRKITAFRKIKWSDQPGLYTKAMMGKLAEECLEKEVVDLTLMYGSERSWRTISEIYRVRANISSSNEIHQAVLKRLDAYGGSKKLLAQLLDEEQQRELEQELEEERQQISPSPAQPCEPILHDQIKGLCDEYGSDLNLSQWPSVFCPLADAFRGTTFYEDCQPKCWQKNLWTSSEFKRVIQTRGESLDSFLRPPR